MHYAALSLTELLLLGSKLVIIPFCGPQVLSSVPLTKSYYQRYNWKFTLLYIPETLCCGDLEGDPTSDDGLLPLLPATTGTGTATGDGVLTTFIWSSFTSSRLTLLSCNCTSFDAGGVKLGKSSWMKFGKNVSIFLQVMSHSCCFGEPTSGLPLGFMKLSNMPWVDMTSSMFFSDSGIASYYG